MTNRGRIAGALALALALAVLLASQGAGAQESPLRVATKKGAFADVRADLEDAIVNQGLKIDFNGKVSDMLKRTGADVGSTKPIYSHAEYFTFCSAALSRAAMEADPENMGYCPYTVFVYERADAPGTVYLGYRRFARHGSEASRKAIGDVEKLLEKVIGAVAK